ncbi:uncharacterized protein V1518DRAFT_436369 [Limtongia smithiae]|uniref:uncharacterized protein n=1 Tax=Limtongia smithiae TaxID=1125753 RepID=UPI0034CEC207
MVRKTSRKITYLLASQNSHNGHTLGVNALAVDPTPFMDADMPYAGQLYSAGRDGMVMSWSLANMNLLRQPYAVIDDYDAGSLDAVVNGTSQIDLNPVAEESTPTFAPPNGVLKKSPSLSSALASTTSASSPAAQGKSAFRSKLQLHTHWVNDLVLTNNYKTVITGSSDLTVKLWTPSTNAQTTIGQHHDFVKCLAVDSQSSDWVASGGLDRKVIIWDLNGGGEKLQIDCSSKGENPKGSVYGLGIGGPGGSIIGSGGPDSVVRLWDQRTGSSIVNFVGHTDNIRALLINKSGNLVLTGSSDSTVKIWSITAGRLMHTLNMHDTSVWSLSSDHPNLEVFYSSDRSGVVVKTDTRGISEVEDSVCVMVCNEHQGVSKVVTSGDQIWTATANSRIHRWRDVDTTPTTIQSQKLQSMRRRSSVSFQGRQDGTALLRQAATSSMTSQIPAASLINLNAVGFGSATALLDGDDGTVSSSAKQRRADSFSTPNPVDIPPAPVDPLRHNPEETIEGQTGLISHIMLNDRCRVLTADTAGEVVLWDLIHCVKVKSFGSRDIQSVADEINTFETMSNWCQVNTRTGQLAVVLEEWYCFDAEIYADTVAQELPPQPTPEPIEFRDDQRINIGKWILRNLFSNLISAELGRDDAYRNKKRKTIDRQASFRHNAPGHLSFAQLPMTPLAGDHRLGNGTTMQLPTPGLAIGLATPAPTYNPANPPHNGELTSPMNGPGVTDYFSSALSSTTTNTTLTSAAPEMPPQQDLSDSEGGNDALSTSNSLMGRLRSFGKGRLVRTASSDIKADGKSDGASSSETPALSTVEEGKAEPSYDDTLRGVIDKVRSEYDTSNAFISSGYAVSPANETPILNIPRDTAIIISEQRADAGGLVDVYRGTVSSCGTNEDVETLESVAPGWLAEFLLLNKIPQKDLVKVSFVLQPFDDALPVMPNGNARLNAYRMLRVRKILSYVEEKLDSSVKRGSTKPEEWLELVCQNQVLDNLYTLATIRARIWRQGGDVVLLYRRKADK